MKQIVEWSFDRIQFFQNEFLEDSYTKLTQVYEQMGHMIKIAPIQAFESDRVFIPNHPVYKIADNVPKLKVVFNGVPNQRREWRWISFYC